MEKEVAEKLRGDKIQEFAFYPHAYTPFEEGSGIEIPDIDVDYEGSDDDSSQSDAKSSTPEWVKNLSFSIGGVTVGAAVVYGLFAAAPPPATPACPQVQTPTQQTCPTSTNTSSPRSPTKTTPAATAPASPASNAAASSSAQSANSTTSSSDGSVR